MKTMNYRNLKERYSTEETRHVIEIIIDATKHSVAMLSSGVDPNDSSDLKNVACAMLEGMIGQYELNLKMIEDTEEYLKDQEEENDRKQLLS